MPDNEVRVEYPEGDYSEDIKREDQTMLENARAMQRARNPLNREWWSLETPSYQEKMQGAAEEGMRLRRSRKRLHEIGEALSGPSTKRSAKRKRD